MPTCLYATFSQTQATQNAHVLIKLAQAAFAERQEPQIFDAFKTDKYMSEDRYMTSKLLEIWFVRELASRMAPNDPVIINCLNPGLCVSEIHRHTTFPLNYIFWLPTRLLGRATEMGSRTLLAAAAADKRSHGRYMDNCVVRDPGKFVLSEEGQVFQRRVYDELLQILETIQPGITKNVKN